MKSIKVSVHAVRDGEIVSGTFLKQRKRGQTWTNEETFSVVSDQPGAERTFVMGDDERLVIEGQSNVKIVYDRAQAAAVPVAQDVDVTQGISPPDTDGDESPARPAVELAMTPAQLTELQAQEKRDAAITAARQRLKQPGGEVR